MLRRAWTIFDRALSWTETVVILSLLATALGVAFFQVVARWFGTGWIWADELVRYMVLWLGIFGAGPATRHHKHIAIDAFVQLAPRVFRVWVRRCTDLMAAAVAFLLVKATVDYIGFVGMERSATLGVTTGTLTWPVAVGFAWIGIRFLADSFFGAEAEGEEGHDHHNPRLDPATYDESLGEEEPA